MPFSSCRALDTPVSSVSLEQSLTSLRANLLMSVGLKHKLKQWPEQAWQCHESKPSWRCVAEKRSTLHNTSNWAAGRTVRTNLQCCGARSSTFSNTCPEQCSLDWHRAPRGKRQCLVLSDSWQQHLILLIIYFLKQKKIFLLYKRHKPKWITHNDLQSTQEYFREKLCSVNYQQFCPFIFSIGSNLESSR